MLDVLHQGLYRGTAVAVVPGNDVVNRVGFRLSPFWAHRTILWWCLLVVQASSRMQAD
ncbi:hypothetical protein [Agrobacterium sp. YIC 4121]|uniref:hypothetical protein n=1 Tax=Agrobacterium sp. YIC 4121 TaxID=1923829 RepID=UPI001301D84B|nr:hypothetical protein [Agrobacterium sp. YIC 4121]